MNTDAEILAQRAARLAHRAAPATQAGERLEVLEFALAAQPCALEIAWVCEVRPLSGATPLPQAVPGVLGAVHVRGRMLPLVDPAPLLGLPAAPWPAQGQLLVIGAQAPLFVIAVSDVHGLGRLSPAQVERRSAPLAPVRPDVVRGLTASGRLLLDGAVLTDHFKNH